MKGDFTSFRNGHSKRYTGVLKQQGRVDLDADWNEHVEIQEYIRNTIEKDVIGACGVPNYGSGFTVNWDAGRQDLTISPGRIYVDGILCELEEGGTSYLTQPNYPSRQALDPVDGRTDLIYLDVWQRHVTAIEDPEIRENALGGPDTTTRLQTVWQVKVLKLEGMRNVDCADEIQGWPPAPGTGRLSTQEKTATAPEDPCLIAPGGGYRGLENRLYRVEIHRGTGSNRPATFIWSRDNGAVVFPLEKFISGEPTKVIVSRLGRDQVLALREGDWVEVAGDDPELNGRSRSPDQDREHRPGPAGAYLGKRCLQCCRTKTSQGPSLGSDERPTIPSGWTRAPVLSGRTSGSTSKMASRFASSPARRTEAVTLDLPPARPRARSSGWWRQNRAALIITTAGWRLSSGARDANGNLIGNVRGCRKLFPPLTQLSPLYYVSGDGQEAMPDLTRPQQLVALAEPLQVGVANRVGAKIRFEITKGNGRLQGTGSSVDVFTGTDARTDGIAGIASCSWELDSSTQSQQVEARLLDEADNPIPLPVRFTANLSVARQVGYNPGSCGELLGPPTNTVQKALERLSTLSSLYYVSGGAQEIMPRDTANQTRFKPLRVLVANKCGPVENATVNFEITEGGGRLDDVGGPVQVNTNSQGIAECRWVLGTAATEPTTQRVMATLINAPGDATHPNPIHEPLRVEFVANLSVAGQVAYTPPNDCPPLAGKETVEQALEALCKPDSGGGCSALTVGDGGQYETLEEALEALRDQDDICISLLPGDHHLPDSLRIDNHRNVELIGCTPGSRMVLGRTLRIESLASCTLRDLEIKAGLDKPVREPLVFRQCDEVVFGNRVTSRASSRRKSYSLE